MPRRRSGFCGRLGAIAIREIQTLAADVTKQMKRDSELAAEKLKEYRKRAHAVDDAASQAEDVAKIVVKAAEEASLQLQATIKKTLENIKAITDQACSVVHEAALAAEKKVDEGRERALIRLKETMQAHL